MIEKVELTDGDKISTGWVKVSRYLDQRLDILRAALEGDMSDVQTAKLRGQIAEVKALQALGKERPWVKE